jgi:hypothetical protein
LIPRYARRLAIAGAIVGAGAGLFFAARPFVLRYLWTDFSRHAP